MKANSVKAVYMLDKLLYSQQAESVTTFFVEGTDSFVTMKSRGGTLKYLNLSLPLILMFN